MKKVLFISDPHCGNILGLTHPNWHISEKTIIGKTQRFIYDKYLKLIKNNMNPDLLVVAGDAIDGKGEKSGGTEQSTTDRLEQAEMATELIKMINPKKVMMVYGTPYHTGKEEDYEKIIADKLGAKITGHLWVEVDGVIFDVKHKIASSGVPHTKGTAIAKEWLWNSLWAERKEAPKADVILRGHVHYYYHCGDADWLAMTLPALQGYGSKFGARQCSGLVDFGLVSFEVNKGDYTWIPQIERIGVQKAKVEKV